MSLMKDQVRAMMERNITIAVNVEKIDIKIRSVVDGLPVFGLYLISPKYICKDAVAMRHAF